MQRKNRYQKYIFLLVLCFLCIFPQTVSAKDKNLNKNSSITLSDSESYTSSESYTWMQYKAPADGYLTITVADAASSSDHAKGYLALYNSTKATLLSSKNIFYNTTYSNNAYWQQFTFGMVKGQTYYLRVKPENAVKISRSFKKVTDKSGALQSAALTLKKNKAKTGLMPAGVSNTDWYQLTLTKKQKIRLYYKAKTNGCYKLSVYSGSKCIGTRNVYYTSGQKKLTICQYQKSTGKTFGMEKGIYYVKIEKADTLTSGYYTLKCK